MAKPQVTVRMYKRILGDCFLIKVARARKRSNILIDCGLLQGVSGDKALMKAVADDIVEETKDEQGRSVIHLLAVTHEHHDHISGFAHARDIFLDPASPLVIEKLWMAWTEKPGDDQADQLRQRFQKMKMGVAAADTFVKALRQDPDAKLAEMDGLEDFVGPVDDALAATGRLTGAKTMQALKDKAESVDFLEPGEVRDTPGPASVRAYVLAPPRNPDRLFNDLPSKGADKETYLNALNAVESLSLSLGVDGAAGGGLPAPPTTPFGKRHQALTVELAGRLASEGGGAAPSSHGLDPLRSLLKRYFDPAEEPRRIDSDTNNGSLVLAFELGDEPGTGEVLLFAADAQVGNWLSWHDQAYPADAQRDKAGVGEIGKVSAESLLNRTVLYKVGHHASHNATLKEKGLELMTDERLVAMIPVVKAIADTKKGWHMPYDHLLDRLVEKTQGRVLRGDAKVGEGLGQHPIDPGEDFKGKVKTRKATNPVAQVEDEFWVEYEVA